MKLMIVDDSNIMRRAIGKYLSALGLDLVATASNGKDALEEFKRTSPDLVTMDITMPQMDGLTCIGEIRKIRSDVKIVVISALGDSATGLKALKLGASAFLSKPFTEAQLVEEIRGVLSGSVR